MNILPHLGMKIAELWQSYGPIEFTTIYLLKYHYHDDNFNSDLFRRPESTLW